MLGSASASICRSIPSTTSATNTPTTTTIPVRSSVEEVVTGRVISMNHHRQCDPGRVRAIVVDPNRRPPAVGRTLLEFTRLEISREVRKEAGGYLRPDTVAAREDIAGDEMLEINRVNASRLEQLPPLGQVAIAGSLDIQARAHDVRRSTVRGDVQQVHPQIDVA